MNGWRSINGGAMSTKVAALEMGKNPTMGLHAGLWISQAILAVTFGMAGMMQISMPVGDLAKSLPWVEDVPEFLVRFIGVCELAGALGMVLPSLTRILPVLTPIAGVGLAEIVLFATVLHLMRGQVSGFGTSVFLGSLSALVAWGRFRKAPIAPRVAPTRRAGQVARIRTACC